MLFDNWGVKQWAEAATFCAGWEAAKATWQRRSQIWDHRAEVGKGIVGVGVTTGLVVSLMSGPDPHKMILAPPTQPMMCQVSGTVTSTGLSG